MKELVELHNGDCLEVLASMPSASVGAIVTDPPYGLQFMQKKWDYDVPSVAIWEQCLRVLTPGGHLLAFAGTRTQHRMAVNIEDAGFEIKDLIMWCYGSGFPKSQNVGKAIDKAAGYLGQNVLTIKREIRARFEAAGMTIKQFNNSCGFEASGYLRETSSWAFVLPSLEKWSKIKEVLKCGCDLDGIFKEAEREIIGYQNRGNSKNTSFMSGGNNITAPATPEAQQWDGWGTALKPALEPITVARKPFKGTVANNVLEHGTGAINIDGCRVATDERIASHYMAGGGAGHTTGKFNDLYQSGDAGDHNLQEKGRWPANLIHDGTDEVTQLFPHSISTGGSGIASKSHKGEGRTISGSCAATGGFGDSGSAARFFYTAKASKDDRDKGNTHPTVKPTDLMAYLCRLVTPTGGIVLDPFMGSGTTGKAALAEGFGFIGIERDPEYYAIAESRFNGAQIGLPLVS